MPTRPTSLCLRVLVAGMLLAGCGLSRGQPLTVPFAVHWHGQPVDCQSPAPAGFQLEDLRLFVHDVRLVDGQGRELPAKLVPDGQWQTERVALIDFVPDCAEKRSRHDRLELLAPTGTFKEVRFALGVPFDLNHANPAVAEGPLAIGAMSWGWQAGYKFLKAEGKIHEAAFRVHLGSTECNGTFGHITGCNRPNRAEISVPRSKDGVVLDLEQLVASELSAPTTCMGDATPACAPAYTAIGLNLQSGLATGGQHAFRAR